MPQNDPPVDEYGIPIRQKGSQSQVDEFGIPIKKKEASGVGSLFGGIAGTLEAPLQEGKKISTGVASSISIPKKKESVNYAEYNKQFEDFTGSKERKEKLKQDFKEKTGLPLRSDQPKGGEILQSSSKKENQVTERDIEEKKYGKYKNIEQFEINPVINKVLTGIVQPKDLVDLYEKPYGEKAVKAIIETELPGVSTMGLGKEVFRSEEKWDAIAAQLQQKNRGQGNEVQAKSDADLAASINDVISSSQYGSETKATQARQGVSNKQLYKFDGISTGNATEVGEMLDKVKAVQNLYDSKGNIIEGGKEDLIKKLSQQLLVIKSNEPLSYEIADEGFGVKLSNAISKIDAGWKKGIGLSQEQVQQYTEQDKKYAEQGLNYLRDANSGTYKNIMRGIVQKETIADTDYEELINIGRTIKNRQDFSSGELVKDDNRDFSTYQTRRANLSAVVSEKAKDLGYTNRAKISDKGIVKAATELGIDPNSKEMVDLRRDEANGGHGFVKGGWLNTMFRSFAEPFIGMQRTVNAVIDNPVTTYLESKRYDLGDQKIADKDGNYSPVLPSERDNFFLKMLGGGTQFAAQIFAARGLGKLIEAPYALGATAVPRAALTAAQSTNIAAYGGGFASTFLQTYGDSYIDFLDKTGNPNKAAFMASVDAVGQSALEIGILPDVKIAESMKGAWNSAKKNLATELMGVVERGGKEAAARPFIKEFLSKSSTIFGKELSEEVSQNAENYLVENLFNPETGKERSLTEETVNVIKEASPALIVPSILGGFGGAKQTRQLGKDALNTVAINFDQYKSILENGVTDGTILPQDYEQVMQIIATHKESLDNAPKQDAKGELLSANAQIEYAFQDTQMKINQQKADLQTTPEEKAKYEKKVAEADEIKRKIFYGEPVKLVDQERELDMGDKELTGDEALLAEVRGKSDKLVALEELPFFIEQTANDPVQAIEKYGEETANTLLSKATDKQLTKAAVNLGKFDKNNPGIDILNKELERREAEAETKIEEPTVSETEGAGSSGVGGDVEMTYEEKKTDIEKRRQEELSKFQGRENWGKREEINQEHDAELDKLRDNTPEGIEEKRQEHLKKSKQDHPDNWGQTTDNGDGTTSVNYTGKKFNDGMSVEATFVDMGGVGDMVDGKYVPVENPYEMIIGTDKPAIMGEDGVLKKGAVVRVGKFKDKAAADEWLKNEKEKRIESQPKRESKINAKYDAELKALEGKPTDVVVDKASNVGGDKSDADIEKRMAELEDKHNGIPSSLKNESDAKEYNSLEKEMEKRERATVFDVPLENVNDAVDTLLKKEKDKPNGFGAFIEKRDARETKEVTERYLNAKGLTDRELKKDFKDALFGNPTTWYADGLKLRESMKEAANRGIEINDLLNEVKSDFTKDGFDEATARKVIAGMLKPVFEGSQKVNEKQLPQSLSKQESGGKAPVTKPNEKVAELEKERDARITKDGKPEVKMEFVTAKELVDSKDPIGNKKIHTDIKDRYKKMRELLDCLWT